MQAVKAQECKNARYQFVAVFVPPHLMQLTKMHWVEEAEEEVLEEIDVDQLRPLRRWPDQWARLDFSFRTGFRYFVSVYPRFSPCAWLPKLVSACRTQCVR